MLKGYINGSMLGKAIVSRPSPCPQRGRVRVKAAPQVAPHFGSTLVHDLVINGEGEALTFPKSFHFMTEWSDKLNRVVLSPCVAPNFVIYTLQVNPGVDLLALRDQVLKTDIILKGKDIMDNLLDSYLSFKTPDFKLPDLDFDHIYLIQSGDELNSHWGWDLVTGISNNLLSAAIEVTNQI
eukprot:jgi/Picsp_1/1064/NSC_04547-R1_---NA---